MLEAIRRFFAPKAPPALQAIVAEQSDSTDARLQRTESHLQAMQSLIGQNVSEGVIMQEVMMVDGSLTEVEVRSDKLLLKDAVSHQSRLVRLDDSLSDYQALEEEVRLQLGRKIARLTPQLAHSEHKILLDHTVKVLKTIALDQTERVRIMLAEELADLPDAPLEVIQQLAWDRSPRVACPILEFSPLLKDDELMEIIATTDVPGVFEAIAKREALSAPLSQAIVESEESGAIQCLLENPGASISAQTLDDIIDKAPQHELWHKGLASRPELTRRTVNRIASFISQETLRQLEESGQIKSRHKLHSRAAVSQRLGSWTEEQERRAELDVRALHQNGLLSDERIDSAIAEVNVPFVMAALSIRCRVSREKVKKILRSESARAITALAWEAGLPMRSALELQIRVGRIQPARLLHARGGTDYPLLPEEMELVLGIFSD